MGKKHKHPEHENLERWLVSYADFITLLFATFVVLYALSQADLAKFKQFSQAVKQAFSPAKSIMQNPGGVMKGAPEAHILKDHGNSILDKIMPKSSDTAQMEGAVDPLLDTVKKINQDIEKLNKDRSSGGGDSIDKAVLKVQERGIVISLSSSLFFEPGSAGIKPSAFKELDKIAPILKQSNRVIHVEGHTDNQPIASAIYPSNWELSSARASSVVRYFTQKQGMPSGMIAAVGYGDTRPVATNTSPVGRGKNRRVDIVILSSSAAKESDAGVAQQSEANIVMGKEGAGLEANHNATADAKSNGDSKSTPDEKAHGKADSGSVSATPAAINIHPDVLHEKTPEPETKRAELTRKIRVFDGSRGGGLKRQSSDEGE